MNADGLPIVLPLGDGEGFYTHRIFTLSQKDNLLMRVEGKASSPMTVKAGMSFSLTYDVVWEDRDIPQTFAQRYDIYLERDFFESDKRVCFSIAPLFLLSVLVILVHRVVTAVRSSPELSLEMSPLSAVAGDVWRKPNHPLCTAAAAGSGAALVAAMLLLAALSTLTKAYQ